jgi:hypothetical protein
VSRAQPITDGLSMLRRTPWLYSVDRLTAARVPSFAPATKKR